MKDPQSNFYEVYCAIRRASVRTPGIYYSLVAVCSLRHGICAEAGNCDSCETRKKIQGTDI